MAKIRRFPLLCLLLVLLLTPFSAWAEGRVFLAGEADPFPKDAELLTLRVADVFGGDCMLMTWREETLMIDAGESFFFPAIQRLLSEAGSGMSLGDIAAQCGYGSHSAFARNFKKMTGKAPSEWIPEK